MYAAGGTEGSHIDKLKVLVVDDDPSIRSLLCIALSVDERVGEIAEAIDGPDALEVVHRFTPDVIVLDHWMPRMLGAKVAPEIRKLHPNVRIVAFSGVLEEHPDWADAFYTKGTLPELDHFLLGA